jgi:NAD(P)-dependent dehydrogenase (short-subunit alcohol dehydrogenase family)
LTNPLQNKVAMVTGAGSGIGRASALAFARAGAAVVVSDISDAAGEKVVKEIDGAGGKAHFLRCDVRDRAAIAALVKGTVERFGRLDCAFNNAGIGGPILKLDQYADEDWDEVIRTNLTSMFVCMKHEIIQMLRQGGGSIVNCASVTGLAGIRGMPAYSASKHGILGITKVAALDYAQQGIRINAVCPGTIHTPAVDEFMANKPEIAVQFLAEMTAAEPIGRLGTPDEIANAVVWLSGPDASFMIGAGLTVDGGYMAQ